MTRITQAHADASDTLPMNTNNSDLHTPASILEALTAETIPAHVAKIKAHLASRQADEARSGKRASNTKVMNRLKREIAHFETKE